MMMTDTAKARPILFSGPMIRALLEGRKTQTRRLVKPQFAFDDMPKEVLASTSEGWADYRGHSGQWAHDGDPGDRVVKCPYGVPGDLLWVREAFCRKGPSWSDGAYYRASDTDVECLDDGDGYGVLNKDGSYKSPWKPSIHMPRPVSRLTLEIIDIRIQRLHDIDEFSSIAEGCFYTNYGRNCWHGGKLRDSTECIEPTHTHPLKAGWAWDKTTSCDQCHITARSAFGNLWESVNGFGSWSENSWVWVVTFNVHNQNIDTFLQARAA